jgi:hypothetical protein
VTDVNHPAASVYCITLAAGIEINQTGLVATPDFASDGTQFSANGNQAIVEWEKGGGTCSAGQARVVTGIRSVSMTGSTDGDVRAVNITASAQPFFFVVP